MVLEAKADDKVETTPFDPDENRQLWRKGCTNNQGYFTLENYEVEKFLTATAADDLEIVSNSELVILEQMGEFVKKQQFKKATRVCKLNSFSDETQRWKLHNSKKLENQEGVWKSDDLWIFKTKDNDLVYIENTSKTKVLEATSDGKVIQEVFEEGKAEQLWKKGKPMAQDYFTLESHSEVPKVITAISESGLEIKGNITLRWIVNC